MHNVRRLFREIRQQGYRGSETNLRETLQPWHRDAPRARAVRAPPLSHLVFRWRALMKDEDRAWLDLYFQTNPALAPAYVLKEYFRTVLLLRDLEALNLWIYDAERSGLRPFERLARGLKRDYDVVATAFVTPWSTAQCEG